jgi:hypothetical protein
MKLWKEIETRLPELTKAAVEAVREPPVTRRRATFSQADLVLVEVRIELDGSFEFFFKSPIDEEIDMGPMVTFSGGIVTGAGWVG